MNKARVYPAAKRAMDIAVSLAGLIILLPVFMLVAAAVLLEDPAGGVFFAQQRVGKGGKHFKLYKFRSMVSDAETLKESLLSRNEMDGPVFKIANDPRVTRVGRFLRKYSIDELPQLWNVIKGDVSLVGPRPLPVAEAEGCNERQKMRSLVRPGLTCLWQISGRNQISFENWMELDLEYIEKQCFRLDILILLKTIPVVLSARGAS